MFRLENPYMVYYFALIPVLFILYYMLKRWKKTALAQFGDIYLTRRLYADVSLSRPGIKFFLLITAFMFLIAGLCGPLIGSKLEEVKRKGADVIIALDVSNSMLATDIKPSRLERAKQSLNRLIDRLEGDRIGIIVFAGEAYVQLPVTTDYNAAKMFISSINPDIVPTQGTAIGAAIDLAKDSFTDTTRKHSAIVIITDGENHEDDAVESARNAAEAGIKVYTIGMGSAEGAPIPIYSNGAVVGFKQDNSGQTVVTKLNPEMLTEIAEAGNGRFIRASTSDDGIPVVLKELNALDKKEFKAKMYTEYENQFQYFIGFALFLFFIEFLLGEMKSKWFAKLNLFHVAKKEEI
ncbi:MAG: VWA domain-containing protein [Bacteroidetes bacterium]|nr:VWA domain-containing protein [Bacteroidota bacterium]